MFQVGDIIRGKPHNSYVWTSEEAVMKVLDINHCLDNKDEAMLVEVIEHVESGVVGRRYRVSDDEKKFQLIKNRRNRKYNEVDVNGLF